MESDPDLKFANTDEFINFSNGIAETDKNFQNFLKTTQQSGTVYKTSEEALAGYQSYLKTLPSSFNYAAIEAKALSVAMKVLSSIGWMALRL